MQDRLAAAYQAEETDGIIHLARTELEPLLHTMHPDDLVRMSLAAVNNKKGQAAGIINGFMAAAVLEGRTKDNAEFVVGLLEALDRVSDTIVPDVVTLCLAHVATKGLRPDILDRAARLAKKQAGSKRRKALAASRRKVGVVSCQQVQSELQILLGKDFSVLYESDELLAVAKPAGVCCYHTKQTTAGRIRKGLSQDPSLEDALLHFNIPLSTLNPDSLGIVHRLDRGTSGCIVLAKTNDMHARLVTEFFSRQAKKVYTVLTAPAPLLADVDCVEINSLVHGRPARSNYNQLERFGETAALGSVQTFTGRKHQVRIHCDELKSWVIGDNLYGMGTLSEDMKCPNNAFFLHAASLSLPSLGLHVEAPLPAWWNTTLASLRDPV
jgi:23S rRNA-/tRNA-specific pseudouridylate synthase